jgi:DNA ligase (NAD+)
MVHFASRDGLDIAGLGRETAQVLVEGGRVKSIADLFTLREKDLVRLDRFADLSAKNLVFGIERAKRTDLGRFLYAIGIPAVGSRRREPSRTTLATSMRSFRPPRSG